MQGSKHSDKRRGTVLVCTLACAVVVIGVGSASVKLALEHRRTARQRHQLQQTQWLLDAGIQRAQRKLQESGTDYQGELWTVPLPHMQGRSAEIEISIEPLTTVAERHLVRVEAVIQPDAQRSTDMETRRSMRFIARNVSGS